MSFLKEQIYSVPEAAKFCNVSRVTLWKYVKSGELKAFKTPGGRNRIHLEDLKAFMQKKGIYPFLPDQPDERRVLVVDDDLPTQKLLNRWLNGKRYTLEYASDGYEAGLKIARFQPHVVILDLLLPEIDGFNVCKKIKEDKDTRDITVIAISGHDQEKSKKRILDLGADQFLPKPLDRKEIKKEVENVFEKMHLHSFFLNAKMKV